MWPGYSEFNSYVIETGDFLSGKSSFFDRCFTLFFLKQVEPFAGLLCLTLHMKTERQNDEQKCKIFNSGL